MLIKFAYLGDTHGQLEPDRLTQKGGLARAATVFADQNKISNGKLITLHGGDILGQTPYSTQFKGEADLEIFSQFFNFSAYAVGNHDFNQGTAGLAQIN